MTMGIINRQGNDFLGNEFNMGNEFSDETARRVDAEVERILREAQQRASEIILGNEDAMHRIGEALLEYETLSGTEVKALYEGATSEELNHRSGPTPPPLPTPPSASAGAPIPEVQPNTPPPAPPAPPLPSRPGNEPA